MSAVGYRSIVGNIFGLGPNGPIWKGAPVGNPFICRGKVIYVDSAVAGSDGMSPQSALGTLDAAFALCTANQGDTIIVCPNHAETVTGAGGITADVAGVRVVGVGVGNQRPRFLMDGGTSVTCLVSAADVTFENLVFAAGHNGVVTCFDVTGVNATFRDIEIEDNTTNEHFLAVWSATGADNTADGLTVERCKWVTVDSGVTDFVAFTGSVNRLTMRDNFFCADAATGAGLLLTATSKVVTGLEFVRNTLICGNTSTDLLIDNDATTNTGFAAWNLCGHHDTAAAVIIDCDGIRQFQNYSTASDTASGLLLPVADVDTN